MAQKGLTERRYHEFMSQKMLALNKLGAHLGMWGPLRKISERSGEQYPKNPKLCAAIKEVIGIPQWDPYARQALMCILDYYEPGWRQSVSLETLGICVDRDAPEVKQWRSTVMERDNYLCQDCGDSENLHAHHLMPWSMAPHMRLIVYNGITLCAGCHSDRHTEMSRFMFVKDIN